MRKRNQTILNDISAFPWWLGLIIAVVIYVLLKYLLPAIESKNVLINSIGKASPSLAPLFSGLVVLAAAKSAFDSWRKGELLGKQKDIKSIKSISWQEFEELVGEVYRRKGYKVTEMGRGGADGGVDLVLKRNGEVIYVQCKQWRMDRVGVQIVRELFGVIAAEGASGGIVISSGTFTDEAVEFVKGKQIEIIDGPELYRMISDVQKNNISVVHKHINKSANMCPLCGSEMILRTAKKGANVGEKFWGCAKFPKCKGTIRFSV